MLTITTRPQQPFSGEGYTDCNLCHQDHVGVTVARMREFLVGGRVLETYLHTPMLVCPTCAEAWEGSGDVAGLAEALVACEQRKRGWTSARLAANNDRRDCPPLPADACDRWRDEIVTGAFHPLRTQDGLWQGRGFKFFRDRECTESVAV